MKRTLHNPGALFLIVGLLAAFILYRSGKADTYARCIDTRTGRIQGNERAEVLREFLSAAQKARQVAADTADTSIERKFNQDAADQYGDLRKRVRDVPLVDC